MPDFDQLTARISQYLETAGVPAFALGIVQGEQLVYAQGFGHIGHGDKQQRVSPDTLFPACSTAKPFVATAILQLVERGLLDLDTPVARWLPWLKYPPGGDAFQVTTRHLLTHTSGLSSDPSFPERFFAGQAGCLEAHLRHDLPGYRAAGRPGEVFWYSNPGFNIAGHLAERLTGTPFGELMRQSVFAPAAMTSTSFEPGFGSRLPTVELPATGRPPILYPAGGAVTTIRDLSRFAISLLHDGRLPRGVLLEGPSVRLMHSIQADAWSRSPRFYGLGFAIESHRGRKLVAHGGGGFGCGTTFVLVPEEKVAIMALFNHPAGYGVQARAILDAVLGEGASPDRGEERRESGPVSGSDSALWPGYTGRYRSAWPDAEGYPAEIEICGSTTSLQMIIPGESHALVPHDDPVYLTEDGGASVGFVPGGRFLMYDGFGIGLVSASPYRRVA